LSSRPDFVFLTLLRIYFVKTMRIKFLFSFVFFAVILLSSMTEGQVIDLGPLKQYCASSEEDSLYKLINEYRRIHKLAPIPFSRSLSYVARTHAMDLAFNRPDFGGCNPHSWSAKGKWKPCCYAHDKNRLLCMNDKPKEITGYKFKGWEMVYSGGEVARASDAFDLWKAMGLTNDYLLNTGKWIKPWKALGIGFHGEYACVWFGEGEDIEKGFGLCMSDTLPAKVTDSQTVTPGQQIQAADNPENSEKYYIITGSLNNQEKAYNEVSRLRKLGYSKARTIVSDENFRISVDEYPTEAEAQKALATFKQIFTGAWVLKPGE